MNNTSFENLLAMASQASKYFCISCLYTTTSLMFSVDSDNNHNSGSYLNIVAEQWKETELTFVANNKYPNYYTDVEFWVNFIGPNGQKMVRPGFWDGGNIFKVRFSNPVDKGEWKWESHSSPIDDAGLNGRFGVISSKPYSEKNAIIKHGLLRMSFGKRNVIHADGTPFLMIADTAWALPFRATLDAASEYAEKRELQGFNASLLMTLQPDRDAIGPRNRNDPGAFDVAFEDLKDGHINIMNVDYFKYLDHLRDILIKHGIVPVYQPVFHGFGWKGKLVLGWNMDAKEYARYCRFLVARFGAQPAMWLVAADSDGRRNGIREGGEEIEKWDSYMQPTGVHYSPFDDYAPDNWNKPTPYVPHRNCVYQDQPWLDFQWCQTGHGPLLFLHKVERMYENRPVKATCDGEPTYEGIARPEKATGWWQGNCAWMQLCSGGTMGVVYGAGGLWNWKYTKNESGWPKWADSEVSWKEALELNGANYVGYVGKALRGLDVSDIEKHPELASGNPCLAKPGKLYIVYLANGGDATVSQLSPSMAVQMFNPVTGEIESESSTESDAQTFHVTSGKPMVVIIKQKGKP